MFNLDKLEFNYIKEFLLKFTYTFEGAKLVSDLTPTSNSLEVKSLLMETSEAIKAMNINGNFPISEISDFSLWLKMLKSASSLSIKALLDLCSILRISRNLIEYYKNVSANDSFEYLKPYFEGLYSNKDVENKISSKIISEDLIADDASNKLFPILPLISSFLHVIKKSQR